MNDQNKPKQRSEETPKNVLGGASAANSSSGVKRLFSRKWVSPALFMAAAAIIVTLMWIYQGADNSKETTATENSEQTDAAKGNETVTKPVEVDVPVVVEGEKLAWPVANKADLQVELPFYDAKASQEERQAALVQTGNSFTAHLGIDFVDPNEQSFDVMAALSGKVSRVEQHPTNGNTIEITHGDGLVTVYQSVSDVTVAEGEEVKQGTVIAKAGRSDLERDLGVHLHFAVMNNGQAINPNTAIGEQ